MKKNELPELNDRDKLFLRCFFKKVITITSLNERLLDILENTEHETLKKLISSQAPTGEPSVSKKFEFV